MRTAVSRWPKMVDAAPPCAYRYNSTHHRIESEQKMKKTLSILLAATALATVPTGTALAKAEDPAAACKNGGFSEFADPRTDLPFTSQGQCVSFVRHGGTLVPIEEEPPVSTATIQSDFFPYSGEQCTWNIRLTGYPSSSVVPVDLVYTNGAGFLTTTGWDVTTNADGNAYLTVAYPLWGGTASASTATPPASDTDTVYC